MMLRKFLDSCSKRVLWGMAPDWLFALYVNYFHRGFPLKGKITIIPSGSRWIVSRNDIKLLSPTAKFFGVDLKAFEKRFEPILKINPGDTVLDVGACLGDTAIPFAIKTGDKGFVIAVEPEPRNIAYLKANTSMFKNVYIVEKAAWKQKEKIKFYLHRSIAGHSIVDRFEDYIEVQADTLDNIVKAWDRIDFAKIDVQGAELQVLEGSEEMLKKTRKIVVETHYFGIRALYPKVSAFLEKRGFTVRVTSDRVVHAWK